MKANKKTKEAAQDRPPDEAEAAHISFARSELRKRPLRTEVLMHDATVHSPHSDKMGHTLALMNLLGSRSPDFMLVSMDSLEGGSRRRSKKQGATASNLNASLALVQAIEPKNEIEAALAVQMSGVHSLASELLGRAKTCETTEQLALYGSLAMKLTRTFSMQIEALAKLRGGGKQQVEVRHVHVNGNAIVGHVHAGGGGGTENEHQPHAKQIAHAFEPPMPSPLKAVGEAVRSSGDRGEEAVPHARWK